MKTKLILIENIEFVVPEEFKAPYRTIKDFHPCCGAGQGFGEKIVPETIWGLKISHCCYIHDVSWELAEASWADFHQSNAMFLTNITITIQARPSKIPLVNELRVYRAATYFNAVSSPVAATLFWKLKSGGKL